MKIITSTVSDFKPNFKPKDDEIYLHTGVEEAVSHWSGKFFKHGHTCVESRVTYRI